MLFSFQPHFMVVKLVLKFLFCSISQHHIWKCQKQPPEMCCKKGCSYTFTRASFLIKLQTGLFYRTLLGDCFWNAFIRKYANESYFSKNVTVWCFNISSSNDKFFICFHTQWEVFFRSKFHPGTKFYSFHPGMKLTCKHKFFHTGMRFRLGYM